MSSKEKPDSESEQRFHITHGLTVHVPPIPRSQVPKGKGACDALVTVAVLNDSEGGSDYSVTSVDGRTGEHLESRQMFRIWQMLAEHLAKELPDGGPKDIAEAVVSTLQRAKEMADAHGPDTSAN